MKNVELEISILESTIDNVNNLNCNSSININIGIGHHHQHSNSEKEQIENLKK